MSNFSKDLSLVVIPLVVLIIDQSSKWWAMKEGRAVLNSGVSFGFFDSSSILLPILLTFVMWIALGWMFRKEWRHMEYALVAVYAGSFSNVIDRIRVGGVIDFLPVPLLQVSNNVADWVIVMGLGYIFVKLLMNDKNSHSHIK